MSDIDMQELMNEILKPITSHDISDDENGDNSDQKNEDDTNINDENDNIEEDYKNDELDFEELLVEAFVLAGYTRKFMQNKENIMNKLISIETLSNMNKGKFGRIVSEFNISIPSATKIYEIIQYNIKKELIENTEEMDEPELNNIGINFSSGHYDKHSQTYRCSLNNVQIIASNSRTRTATIEINKKQIENFVIQQNAIQNPLIILLGISEYDGINCCQQLIDVKYDMIALRRLFQSMYGYVVIHRNDRMNWRAKQIIDFFHYTIKQKLIHHQINKLKEDYDGVIVCISSYFKNNHIYSSDEHAINLEYIYQIFGEMYPALLSLPRLFIINTYPITTNYFYHIAQSDEKMSVASSGLKLVNNNKSNNSNSDRLMLSPSNSARTSFRKSLSRINTAYKPLTTKIDIGQRRMTIFGQSFHGNRLISYGYNTCNDEDNGCSLFYRSVINSFKHFTKFNKYRIYTPYLSVICDEIESNLKQLYVENKSIEIEDFNNYNLKFKVDEFEDIEFEPFVYRIGDIQFMKNIKYKKLKLIENDEKKCELLTEFRQNQKIVCYLYKEIKSNQYYNVSNLTLSEIHSKLLDGTIEAQVPTEHRIENILCAKNKSTLYALKNYNGLRVQLRSIGGLDSTSHKHKVYGDKKKASSEFRYLKICVRNDSKNYHLSLDISLSGSYLYQCEYLEIPTYRNLACGYEHTYFVIGLDCDSSQYYDCMSKYGVVGGLQYIVRDANTGKDTNMRFVCVFKGVDVKNNLKDLVYPYMDCLYCDKTQVNLEQFVSKLNDKQKKKKQNVNIDCKSSELHSAFFRFSV
eukprot:282961_1